METSQAASPLGSFLLLFSGKHLFVSFPGNFTANVLEGPKKTRWGDLETNLEEQGGFSCCSLFLLIFKGKGLILTWSPCPSFPALCGGGDSFLCASGLCVPGKLQCNGHNDCDDWSDEAHCSRRGARGRWGRGAGAEGGHPGQGPGNRNHSAVRPWQPPALAETTVSLPFWREQTWLSQCVCAPFKGAIPFGTQEPEVAMETCFASSGLKLEAGFLFCLGEAFVFVLEV